MIPFRQQLANLGLISRASTQPMSAICKHIADMHACELADIKSSSRIAPLVTARWAAWSACERAGYNHSQIGRYTGHDPSSVLHGIRRHRGEPAPKQRPIIPVPDADAIRAARMRVLA